jgi:hypothetical protein
MPSWRSPSDTIAYTRWSIRSWSGRLNSAASRRSAMAIAHAVGKALAERSGRRLDTGGQAVFGVTRRARAPLPERFEVLERDSIAGQVEQRVEAACSRARLTARTGRGSATRDGSGRGAGSGSTRRTPSAPRPSGARVTRVRLLDAVHRERPDGVDGESVEVGGDGHRSGSRRAETIMQGPLHRTAACIRPP